MIALAIIPGVIDGTGVASLAAGEPLAEAIRRLAGGAEVLAVAAADGSLLGLLDASDVIAALAADGVAALAGPVSNCARPAPDWLAPGDTALDALELMRLRTVDHLPVLDDDGRLVGIVGRRRLCALLHEAFDAATDARHRAVFGFSPEEG